MTTENNTDKTTHPVVRIVRTPIATANNFTKNTGNGFQKFSNGVSTKAGSPFALMLAVVLVLVWALTGPAFKFSETWQLVINTGTTIITFLMVFAIQNTQNRDSKAVQLKLDELIRGTSGTKDDFINIEELTDSELNELHEQFKVLHEKVQAKRDKLAKN